MKLTIEGTENEIQKMLHAIGSGVEHEDVLTQVAHLNKCLSKVLRIDDRAIAEASRDISQANQR